MQTIYAADADHSPSFRILNTNLMIAPSLDWTSLELLDSYLIALRTHSTF